jgi:CTP-dependent riboflavin kinase
MQAGAMPVLRGRVESGQADLAHWMRLHALKYSAATGLHLFPGSLNVRLDAPYELPEERIRLSADEVGVAVNLVAALAFGRPIFIFRTDADDAKGPEQRRLIELLSDLRLREVYDLADGDLVEVAV